MDDEELKTLKKNSSNRKPISYSTEFRLDINLNNFVILCPAMINMCGRGGELKCYINTYIHTEPPTEGPRGAFTPNKNSGTSIFKAKKIN